MIYYLSIKIISQGLFQLHDLVLLLSIISSCSTNTSGIQVSRTHFCLWYIASSIGTTRWPVVLPHNPQSISSSLCASPAWRIFILIGMFGLSYLEATSGSRIYTVQGSKKLHTFCEFPAEFSWVNNQTLQKTYIKPYLFIYLAFNVRKTHGKSWKITIISLVFCKISPIAICELLASC